MPQLQARDALNITATKDDVGAALKCIEAMPVIANDGNVFFFGDSDILRIKSAIQVFDQLDAMGYTDHHDWLLANGSSLTVTRLTLLDYLIDLEVNRDLRTTFAWGEHRDFVNDIDNGSPPTLRDLDTWKKSYEVI